jgi:hypothetical protein
VEEGLENQTLILVALEDIVSIQDQALLLGMLKTFFENSSEERIRLLALWMTRMISFLGDME